MTRWLYKRWAWAAVVGATVTVGGARAGEPPQKVGAVVTLNIDGKGDRQFKVLKTEKQPDGSYLSELKDAKSGETITLLDKPDSGSATPPKAAEPPKAPDSAPKAKPRTTDPLLPPVAATLPDADKNDKEKDKEREKRPILGRIFGDRDDSAKRPGLMSRVFGRKPAGPSMPPATAGAGPVATPGASTPPAVRPTPPGGVTSTAEPPRVMPAKPAPVVPPVPSTSTPIPVPMPPPGGLPIPIPPGGTSAAQPLQVVVPVGYVPAGVAFDRDVQPFVIALQSMTAPSARLTAARALADGRHASTDGVKGVLFEAARMDPCGEVRAACIAHLCKLGYFDPQFLAHVRAACDDPDPLVSAAAKAACAKMIK